MCAYKKVRLTTRVYGIQFIRAVVSKFDYRYILLANMCHLDLMTAQISELPIFLDTYSILIGTCIYLLYCPGGCVSIVYVDQQLFIIEGRGDIGNVAHCSGNSEGSSHGCLLVCCLQLKRSAGYLVKL